MTIKPQPRRNNALAWLALGIAIGLPIGAAAFSPLLEWRSPIYIVAGFAGIVAFGLLFVQPLLARGFLPGLTLMQARSIHRMIGEMVVAAVLVHVGGLWLTSPPDVIDALLLRSPTPFSVWGVIAMWAVFATAILALLRKRLRLTPRTWRGSHATLTLIIVLCTALHAILIQGAMEPVTKAILALLVPAASLRAWWRVRI